MHTNPLGTTTFEICLLRNVNPPVRLVHASEPMGMSTQPTPMRPAHTSTLTEASWFMVAGLAFIFGHSWRDGLTVPLALITAAELTVARQSMVKAETMRVLERANMLSVFVVGMRTVLEYAVGILLLWYALHFILAHFLKFRNIMWLIRIDGLKLSKDYVNRLEFDANIKSCIS